MALTDQLLILADTYCAATGRSRSRVATLIFNDGKKLDLVAGGADVTTRGYERALRWFADNWPAAAAWPEGVTRPDLHPAQERQPLTLSGQGAAPGGAPGAGREGKDVAA